MTAQQQQNSFAEIAVELSIAQQDVDFAELAWSTWMQSTYSADRAAKLEVLSARIGLSVDATAHVMAAERTHRDRIAEAHDLFRRLIPHEAKVRAMLAEVPPEAETRMWRRLVDFVRRGGRSRG